MNKSARGFELRQRTVGRVGPLSSPGLLPLLTTEPATSPDRSEDTPPV